MSETGLVRKLEFYREGGGNRTAGSSPGSDDSQTISRTGIPEDTVKQYEPNALADVLMTMSQIPVPDAARDLAEVSALHALFEAAKRERGQP